MTRDDHMHTCALDCYFGRDYDGAPDITTIDEYEAEHGISFTREDKLAIVAACNLMCLKQPPTAVGKGSFTAVDAKACLDQLNRALDERSAKEA